MSDTNEITRNRLPVADPLRISESDAFRLCQTGEWITDITLSEQIKKSQTMFLESANLPERKLEQSLESFPHLLKEAEDLNKAVRDSVRQSFECKEIIPSMSDPPTLELRVKAGCVYKIGATSRKVISKFVGLVLAILTTPYSVLFGTWSALNLYELFRTIYSGWEQLTDPDERQVFEAIFELQAHMAVVDYDALKNKNYHEAYGHVSPTDRAIQEALSNKLSKKEVLKALASLEKRNIIDSRNGRWSISF